MSVLSQPHAMPSKARKDRGTATQTGSTSVEEYWDWVAVGLFLMVTVDLLTSLYAAEVVGIEHESNPVIRYLLSRSVGVVALAHIAAVVLVSYFFYVLFEVLKYRSGDGRWSRIALVHRPVRRVRSVRLRKQPDGRRSRRQPSVSYPSTKSRSSSADFAPTARWTGSPSLKTTRVGTLRTP